MSQRPKPPILKAQKTPEPIDLQVGQLIKAQRLAIGMSLETLADAIGVTFQQVQKYEKGMNRVGSSRLVMIAAALHVTPAFFFADTKSAGTPELLTLVGMSGAVELLRAFAAIKGIETRRAIVLLLQSIAKQNS